MSTRALALVLILPSAVTTQVTDAISRTRLGAVGNGSHGHPALSLDGRTVAFSSSSTNLVPGDTNGHLDVFVRDPGGEITLVSRGLGGAPADGVSEQPALSGDGRIVAFLSRATNLVPGDTNGAIDAFAYDREQDSLERLNVDSQEAQSVSDGYLGRLSLTRDGRFVLFDSPASDLVPGDTNGSGDVFLRDRQAGTTVRLSTFPNGSQIPGDSFGGALTPSGRTFAFSCSAQLVPGDFNQDYDVYVRDLVAGTIQRASVSSQGVEGNDDSTDASLSSDGRFVVFASFANNLVPGDVNLEGDIFVRDRLLATTQRVSVSSQGLQANRTSWRPRISDDGRHVYYLSMASNLVPEDPNWTNIDVFVRDRRLGTTTRFGLLAEGDAGSRSFALTPDGSRIAFTSDSALPGLPAGQLYLRVQPAPGPSPIH